MPELPEVETVRRSLARHIVGATVTAVDVRHAKFRRQDPGLARWVTGRQIRAVERRAKLLILRFTGTEDVIGVHLKMTGQFLLQAAGVKAGGGHSDSAASTTLPNAHTRFIWSVRLQDGAPAELYFNDQRLFAYAKRFTAAELQQVYDAYGVEPGTPACTFPVFQAVLAKRQAPLKAVLLDQSNIAGLGNIYVDEACFRAKVRPTRRAASLKISEQRALWQACNDVITEAIELGGTTFRNYQDVDGRMGGFVDRLRVYGLADQPCSRCGSQSRITKVACAGRGTHFCRRCQS